MLISEKLKFKSSKLFLKKIMHKFLCVNLFFKLYFKLITFNLHYKLFLIKNSNCAISVGFFLNDITINKFLAKFVVSSELKIVSNANIIFSSIPL